MIRVTQGPEINEETLAALSSGRMDPAIELFLVSTAHMRGVSIAEAETVAGSLLEAESPVEMRADALERALAAIEQAAPAAGTAARPADADRALIQIPETLRRRIEQSEQTGRWKSGGGLSTLDLELGGDCKAEIIRIPAGAGVPRHTHAGQELTLCLSGGFSDGIGAYGPGDVSITDPSITHQPVADEDGPCYVLAVTDAGLKFTGALGFLQKLFGR